MFFNIPEYIYKNLQFQICRLETVKMTIKGHILKIFSFFDRSAKLTYCNNTCFSGAQAVKRLPLRQFAPLLIAMVGLPGRGKSLLARRLARYLNYTGDTTKGKQYGFKVYFNNKLFLPFRDK